MFRSYGGGIIFFILISVATSTLTAQSWEQESPQFPVYNTLLRKYKALKPAADRPDLSGPERDSVNAQLRELKQMASALQDAQTSTPNGSEELKLRYKYLLAAVDKDIARIEGSSPSDTPTAISTAGASIKVLKTRDFSPGDEVEFSFTVPAELAGKIWVGLMKSSEPKRDIPYINTSVNISKFQPKTLESRSDGIFQYAAPNEGGMWEVRMFEKESGRQMTSAQFRVETRFVEELKMWQKEVSKLNTELVARYGRGSIHGTFVSTFAGNGGDYDRNAQVWSDRFYVTRISNSPGTEGHFFFVSPLELLHSTRFTIETLRYKYSQSDVEHYREGMRAWRQNAPKIFPMFEKLISVSAEMNREKKDSAARIAGLSKQSEKDAEFQRSKGRLKAMEARYDAIVADLKRLQNKPIFARRGSVKPAGS